MHNNFMLDFNDLPRKHVPHVKLVFFDFWVLLIEMLYLHLDWKFVDFRKNCSLKAPTTDDFTRFEEIHHYKSKWISKKYSRIGPEDTQGLSEIEECRTYGTLVCEGRGYDIPYFCHRPPATPPWTRRTRHCVSCDRHAQACPHGSSKQGQCGVPPRHGTLEWNVRGPFPYKFNSHKPTVLPNRYNLPHTIIFHSAFADEKDRTRIADTTTMTATVFLISPSFISELIGPARIVARCRKKAREDCRKYYAMDKNR